jgi:hypothetical protein
MLKQEIFKREIEAEESCNIENLSEKQNNGLIKIQKL